MNKFDVLGDPAKEIEILDREITDLRERLYSEKSDSPRYKIIKAALEVAMVQQERMKLYILLVPDSKVGMIEWLKKYPGREN